MSKQLLDVIQQVFVKNKGVRIIMTTHSPSTIALTPEESLFTMQKESRILQKSTKDKILKLLTSGVPSFSVAFNNNRQVFVESETDVQFYSKIYNKVKNKIPNEIALYFISSGIAKGNSGNCDQVKEIVNMLVNKGTTTIFGVIDWDLKNNDSRYIKVIGHKKRYSIENYVFDPIILIAYLIREKIVENRSDFGLTDDENYYHLVHFNETRLQNIIKILMNKIRHLFQPPNESEVAVYYHNKVCLNIPLWYLHHNGHELEERIKDAYPSLKKFKKNELKMDIVNRVFDDLPEFIPIDIIDLFQDLQNN